MTKRRGKETTNQLADWWLWPSALIMMLSGWGQALWMWENIRPVGLAPLWLLLWNGVGVSGVTMPVQWLARRWRPAAWLAMMVWVLVPSVYGMAGRYDQASQLGEGWLPSVSPLLSLALLGVGLSGVMMSLSQFVGRHWPGPAPKIRPLRQGLWAGLFAVMCGWLLINRVFGLMTLAFLAGALVLIEVFFVMRELSPQR